MKLRNMNERFGELTVYESPSKNCLPEGLSDMLWTWANEHVQRQLENGVEYDPCETPEQTIYDYLREEFIAGLEEVD